MKTINIVMAVTFAALVFATIVGIIDSATQSGPNCPAPVPADWLGYCEDYDLR